MVKKISTPKDYPQTLEEIKTRIRQAQSEALKAVNRELNFLYWDIGSLIARRQKDQGWGKSVVEPPSIGVAAYRIVRGLPAERKGKPPESSKIQRLLEAVALPKGADLDADEEGK